MIQMIMITIIVYGLLRLLEYIVVVYYKKYNNNGYGMEKMKNENRYIDRRSDIFENDFEVEYMESNVEEFYYLTKYGERVHTISDCDGLRKRTQPVEKRTMCQLCRSGMSVTTERRSTARPRTARRSSQHHAPQEGTPAPRRNKY